MYILNFVKWVEGVRNDHFITYTLTYIFVICYAAYLLYAFCLPYWNQGAYL